MWRILNEAVWLWGNRLPLFTAIILTVWLPGNLLINWLAFYVLSEDDWAKQIRLTVWIEGIFGPIYLGALVYAVACHKLGQAVSYPQAMAVGLKNWRRLFGTRFLAGLLTLLRLILLIVPGIVLLVRYALIDAIVVLEDTTGQSALRRSTELTNGRRWQIFGAATVLFIGYVAMSFGIYLPTGVAEQLDTMAYNVIADSVLDVVFGVIQVAMVLFFWAAKDAQAAGRVEGQAAAVV
ncbi:MAG: hypothetical protein HYY24_26335 [Verrucomicrobia bacterium]|nr:hypothetical protein [Verrucomicrobiota bacterium]